MIPQGELRSPLTPPLKETVGFLFLLCLYLPLFLNFNNKQFSMGSYSRQATPLRERRVSLFPLVGRTTEFFDPGFCIYLQPF